MPKNELRSKAGKKPKPSDSRSVPDFPSRGGEVPAFEAFLEEARKEAKRKLLSDHVDTITVLRDEKRFTFRAIADWLTARGIEADHSAVYRAYLAGIPAENRDPLQDWEDVDVPE